MSGLVQSVRRAQVSGLDAVMAAREFHSLVVQKKMGLVVFFCTSHFDLTALAAELARLFGNTPVIGCTSAGEIGPAGYVEGTLAGASFSGDSFVAVCRRMEDLSGFATGKGQAFVSSLLRELEARAPHAHVHQMFAFQLIDGLSIREELVTHAFQSILGKIPLVGGSAGDDHRFRNTHVYYDGAFHADSVVLALMATTLPFRVFMSQQFEASERRVVVTSANPSLRLIRELDGRPAADVYAEMIGVARQRLCAEDFAASPLVVVIGGMNYVRAISRALPDGSLEFYCAIDEGIVLRLAHSADLVKSLEITFATLQAQIGPLQATLGCDCIQRKLDMKHCGVKQQIADVMESNRVIGFNTYGEQYGGAHVNQTFTGVAFGYAENRKND